MIEKLCDKYNISNAYEKLLVLTEEEKMAFLDEDCTVISLMKEPLDVFLTRFGIAEWSKKSICLGSKSSEEVLKRLGKWRVSREDNDSILLEMTMLPFPEFVKKYFSNFPNGAVYLKDPAFGYKLFLSTSMEITYLVNIIKGIPLERSDATSIINERYMTPDVSLSQYMKEQKGLNGTAGGKNGYYQRLLWFLHLSKYIDAEKAEELGLTFLCTAHGYCGFELDEKLSLLNNVPRELLKDYFGYDSGLIMSFDEISKKYHVTRTVFKNLIEDCLPYMMGTTAGLKSHLRNKNYSESEDDFQTYLNPNIETTDYKINTEYYWGILNDRQREIINEFSTKKKIRNVILAYLFLTKDINKLINMPFYLSKADIEMIINSWMKDYNAEFEKAKYYVEEGKCL